MGKKRPDKIEIVFTNGPPPPEVIKWIEKEFGVKFTEKYFKGFRDGMLKKYKLLNRVNVNLKRKG